MSTYYGVSAWQWQSNSDYLAHHGILGQKWGKRNGPPYPLSAGAHSSAEKQLKSKNEGELESWKAKKTAKIDKVYSRKIGRVNTAISKTNKESRLERLKLKKAELIFKQNMKKTKVQMTTEKEYAIRKKIKKALVIVGAIAVTALAVYALNTLGGQRAYNRMMALKKESRELSEQYISLSKMLNQVHMAKGSDAWKKSWTDSLMKEINELSNPKIFAASGLNKATKMYDIYKYGSIFEKIVTQIKGF